MLSPVLFQFAFSVSEVPLGDAEVLRPENANRLRYLGFYQYWITTFGTGSPRWVLARGQTHPRGIWLPAGRHSQTSWCLVRILRLHSRSKLFCLDIRFSSRRWRRCPSQSHRRWCFSWSSAPWMTFWWSRTWTRLTQNGTYTRIRSCPCNVFLPWAMPSSY